MDEKRKSKRLDLSVVLLMKRLDATEAKEVSVDVFDLSKTGIGFSCGETLELGSVYESNIRIWTGDTIHAFIEIVRGSKQDGTLAYGGIFVGMPEADWCRIGVYETYQEFGDEQN